MILFIRMSPLLLNEFNVKCEIPMLEMCFSATLKLSMLPQIQDPNQLPMPRFITHKENTNEENAIKQVILSASWSKTFLGRVLINQITLSHMGEEGIDQVIRNIYTEILILIPLNDLNPQLDYFDSKMADFTSVFLADFKDQMEEIRAALAQLDRISRLQKDKKWETMPADQKEHEVKLLIHNDNKTKALITVVEDKLDLLVSIAKSRPSVFRDPEVAEKFVTTINFCMTARPVIVNTKL
mmetsp:Transcript_41184/g.62640  ORF Transcript_41184/g.62640 Transcript_41184/m.62640 type:complete len:240 (+) Transcript_41184:1699-2418(+)